MKKSIFLTSVLTILVSLTASTGLVGQEVPDQNNEASSLAPAEESVEMEYDDLPDPVRKVLQTDKYAGWEVDKVYKAGKRLAVREYHYTIRFNTDGQVTDVYLDENGNVIDPQDSDNTRGSKTDK